jgi:hypothetical protein
MEKRRQVTEEDLLVTEALIAESYRKLKLSVIQVPSRAYHSLGQTVSEHPYESAVTAVGGGAAAYGIINMLSSRTSAREEQGLRIIIEKEKSRPDIMQEMLPIIIPLVTPYIAEYLQKYIGGSKT